MARCAAGSGLTRAATKKPVITTGFFVAFGFALRPSQTIPVRGAWPEVYTTVR